MSPIKGNFPGEITLVIERQQRSRGSYLGCGAFLTPRPRPYPRLACVDGSTSSSLSCSSLASCLSFLSASSLSSCLALLHVLCHCVRLTGCWSALDAWHLCKSRGGHVVPERGAGFVLGAIEWSWFKKAVTWQCTTTSKHAKACFAGMPSMLEWLKITETLILSNYCTNIHDFDIILSFIYFFDNILHKKQKDLSLDSESSHGLHVDSITKYNDMQISSMRYVEFMEFRWTLYINSAGPPANRSLSGLRLDSTTPCGLHMESRRNIWGREKSSARAW